MNTPNEYDSITENREAITELLKNEGLNLVPIPKGSGKALTNSWTKYQTEKFIGVITRPGLCNNQRNIK